MVPSAVTLGRISHGVGCSDVQSGMMGYTAWPAVGWNSVPYAKHPENTILTQAETSGMTFHTSLHL